MLQHSLYIHSILVRRHANLAVIATFGGPLRERLSMEAQSRSTVVQFLPRVVLRCANHPHQPYLEETDGIPSDPPSSCEASVALQASCLCLFIQV